jgi:hypothetical protein
VLRYQRHYMRPRRCGSCSRRTSSPSASPSRAIGK